jgi:hypothetical protein
VRGDAAQQVLDEHARLGQAGAPAGLLAVSANDMARWLQIQLGHGAIPGGGRLFSADDSEQMWRPVTPEPIEAYPGPLAATTPNFLGYALGWEVQDYHGHKIVWHSGAVFGFTSIVCLIPEKNVGFAIELNSEDIEPRFGLMYELLDHYLGVPPTDWVKVWGDFKHQRIAAAEALVAQKGATPAAIGPSLPLERYAGAYKDAWYGPMSVSRDAQGLRVDFPQTPGMHGRLEHYQYDSFIARFDDKGIEPAYMTFGLDADGKVARVTMKPVSPIADFSFDYQDLLFRPAGAAGGSPAEER